MPKISGAAIQSSIENFDMEQPSDVLSEAFKNAKTQQEFHKQNSEEFKILETFKKKVTSKIRAMRKGPSIEELDTIAEQEKKDFVQPDISARDEGVED